MADWPRNREDTFVDPYAGGAPAMDFAQDDPAGGQEVNRQIAHAAMRRKRKAKISPDQMREKMAMDILDKYSQGTDQPIPVQLGDGLVPARSVGLDSFNPKFGYNRAIDFAHMSPEEQNILRMYAGAKMASK